MREITAETVATLTAEETYDVEQAWLQHSRSQEYLAARDAAGAILGEVWFIDPAEAFMALTVHGQGLNLPYSVISAARWAYVAATIREDLAPVHYEVLAAAWSVLP